MRSSGIQANPPQQQRPSRAERSGMLRKNNLRLRCGVGEVFSERVDENAPTVDGAKADLDYNAPATTNQRFLRNVILRVNWDVSLQDY